MQSSNKSFTTSFGLVATLLEIIPFASMFFSFTNTGKYNPHDLS